MKRYLILLLILNICCTKAEREILNLHGGRIFVIGHGGAGFENAYNYIPENSMASIERAINLYNADGVEVDIQLTKDNELVLYHDDRLETQTNCFGCIRSYNLEEIIQCRYTRNFYTVILTDQRLVPLRTVFARYSQYEKRPLIFLDTRKFTECYINENADTVMHLYASAILALIDEFNYHEDVYIESPSVEFLIKMKQSAPGLKYLIDSSDFDLVLQSVVENGFYGMVASNKKITKDQVKKAHEYDVNVVIFDLRSRGSNVDAVNKHPDYIQTDDIQILQQILMNK